MKKKDSKYNQIYYLNRLKCWIMKLKNLKNPFNVFNKINVWTKRRGDQVYDIFIEKTQKIIYYQIYYKIIF